MTDDGDVLLPVLTVTCPSCGAGLKNAELGTRTRCVHCGTELHVPEVVVRESPPDPDEHARDAGHEHAGEEQAEEEGEEEAEDRRPPPPPARGLGTWFALVILATFVLMIFLGAAHRPSASYDADAVSTPKTQRDVELEGLLAHSKCRTDCSQPCMAIKDPPTARDCLHECARRCRHVGKGTPAECRGRCGTKCSTAPDSYRARCETDCAAECP